MRALWREWVGENAPFTVGVELIDAAVAAIYGLARTSDNLIPWAISCSSSSRVSALHETKLTDSSHGDLGLAWSWRELYPISLSSLLER